MNVTSSHLYRKLRPRALAKDSNSTKFRKEDAKVIISESISSIFKKFLVHLLPISTTILILSLNLHDIYIGEDFTGPIRSETINLLLLQIAAKIHEILIGGSLATIVLHAVRNELLFGDGLPLGLVGSGLSFNTLDYFFRKEFYGSVFHWYDKKNTFRRARFVLLLLVSGMLATLSGPSSAVLLVPKSQDWPSGGTNYFLNGKFDDFWPSDLSGNLTELQSICQPSASTELAVCPASGFNSLWEHWGRATVSTFTRREGGLYAKGLSGSDFFWPVYSPTSQVVPRYVLGNARADNETRTYTFLVQPHAAPATLLQQITSDWWSAIAPEERVKPSEIDDRKAESTFFQAITSVRCSEPQNLSINDYNVLFPPIEGRFDFGTPIALNLTVLDNNPSDHLKFQWIHLPETLGAASIGGVFQTSWINNQSRTVVGCSAQAGWVSAQAQTDAYTFWTGWYPWNISFGSRLPSFHAEANGQELSATNGRIAIGDAWLSLLTPITILKRPDSRISTPTTIESILESAGLDERDPATASVPTTSSWASGNISDGTRTVLLEAIISNVMVDGISRYGSHRIFQNATDPADTVLQAYQRLPDFNARVIRGQTALVKPTTSPDEVVTLQVNMQITGFSYQQSVAGILSMTVLVLHLIMAVSHMIWIVYTGQTSAGWSMISEIIAIAYNSPTQSSCLINAGAGIKNGSTFGKIAKIRARPPLDDTPSSHVNLVFDEDDETFEISQALVDIGVNYSFIKRRTVPTAAKSSGRIASIGTVDEEEETDDHVKVTGSSESLVLPEHGLDILYEVVKVNHAYG